MVNYLWKTRKEHVNVEGSHIIIWWSQWNKRSWGGVAAIYYSWRESWRRSKFGKATTKCPNSSGESTQMHINQSLARDSFSPLYSACSSLFLLNRWEDCVKILYLQIMMTKCLIWESTDKERPLSNTMGGSERGRECDLMMRVIWKWYGSGRAIYTGPEIITCYGLHETEWKICVHLPSVGEQTAN